MTLKTFVDTKIMSLTSILRELWQIIEFHGGHFVFRPYILCIYNKSDVTIGFLDLENIGIDTKINFLTSILRELWQIIVFLGGHLVLAVKNFPRGAGARSGLPWLEESFLRGEANP